MAKKQAKLPTDVQKVPKFFRDILAYKAVPGSAWPGNTSPICTKCGLDECGAKTPYMPPSGSNTPLVTFVFEAPSKKEDAAGELAADGQGAFIKKMALDVAKDLNLDPSTFRFAPITRCAVVSGKGNPATGGKWCRYHLYEDFKVARPKIIVTFGTPVLGLLNQKSNASDWGGKLLTWRGWPDDWLVDRKFESGHPVYGDRPTLPDYLPLFPLQKPQIVYGTRNPKAIAKWRGHLKKAMELAVNGVVVPTYDRPWWKITDDPNEVIAACKELINNQGTIVTYDTETTGLKPFLGNKIVFMMIRWTDSAGNPRALGWPWDYRAIDRPPETDPYWAFSDSPMLPHLDELAPWILRALSASKLRGHNLTFDLLFTIGSVKGGLEFRDKLCEAFYEDTWHMRYALRQERGSIGLEILAYDWAPSLAGYEEDFTLLIQRYPELLHPEQGGHYANCPRKFWDVNFRPYVMGDVEVCAEAADGLNKALAKTAKYEIPLAHTTERGKFRKYSPPNRLFVYHKILAPAGAMLAKLMARGMYVDTDELSRQEKLYPKMIIEARKNLRESDPELVHWCEVNEAADPTWEFDLGDASILKTALFDVMKLPIVSLTKAGVAKYKTLEEVPPEDRIKFASTDKFSLNHMAAKFPKVRPLLAYRSLHKQYCSYVRPLRNITTPGIDKKPRDRSRILMTDNCVHASFKLAGTRGGRLSCCVDGDTTLDAIVGGVRHQLKIRDLEISNIQDVLIMTHKYRLRRIIQKYEKPDAEMFEVTTSGGRKIVCTAGHRFLTGSGWKHLRDIAEGDFVKVDTRQEWATVCGGGLRQDARLLAGHEGASGRWVQQEDSAEHNSCLQRQVPCQKEADSWRGVVDAPERKHEWMQASVHGVGQGRVREAGKQGVHWLRSLQALRAKWIHHRQKHADALVESSLEVVWLAKIFRRIAAGTARSILSRYYSGVSQLRRGQDRIFAHGVQGIPEVVMPSMVDSGFLQDSNNDESEEGSARLFGRDCMALQPGRGLSSPGAAGEEYTACARVQLRAETGRQNGRFCDYWHQHFNRSGRQRLPRSGEGQTSRREDGSIGVQCATVYDSPGARGHCKGNGGDRSGDAERVVSIRFVGVRPVFDIQVEDDNSYLAHGFVNHNSDPNLQQLPREGLIKKQFVSRFGSRGCIYQADLSQIELRLLAAFCGDPTMVKAYMEDIDLHSLTTSLVFGIPYEQFGDEYEIWLQKNGKADEAKKLKGKRKIGKTLNFLTGYGGGAYGFQTALAVQGIYISLEEAEQHVNNFFSTYPYLKTHIGHYKNFIAKHGRAVSVTGRVRIFDEVYSDDFSQVSKAMRAGYNHLIQSTASDIMLICMVAIERLMREYSLESIMVSTVHDSLAVDAIKQEVPQIHEITEGVLSNIPEVMSLVLGDEFDISPFYVPLEGDSSVGKSYYDEIKIPKTGLDWDATFQAAFGHNFAAV